MDVIRYQVLRLANNEFNNSYYLFDKQLYNVWILPII